MKAGAASSAGGAAAAGFAAQTLSLQPPQPPQQPQQPAGTLPLPSHLEAFCYNLHQFARYSRLQAVAGLQYGDQLSTSSMVCSAAFDR